MDGIISEENDRASKQAAAGLVIGSEIVINTDPERR